MIVSLFVNILCIGFVVVVDSAVLPACQPPNNCSVHVFRVRLSQKPDEDGFIGPDTSTVTVLQRRKYGSNYFEIKGGAEMSPEFAKEIMQNMPENTDPRLKEKIIRNDFYLKPVDSFDSEVHSGTIPPPPQPSPATPQTPPANRSSPTVLHSLRRQFTSLVHQVYEQYPMLVFLLLVLVGVIIGALIAVCCVLCCEKRKTPKFDRSHVITYKRSLDMESLVQPERRQRTFVKRSAGNQSQSYNHNYHGLQKQTRPHNDETTFSVSQASGRVPYYARPSNIRRENSLNGSRQISL